MEYELKTPIDKRTRERKQLIKKVREIKQPYYLSEYGIWAHLNMRIVNQFTNFYLN